MIQLKISGRTGNQLFQYAMAENYILENNLNEKLIITLDRLNQHKTDKSFKLTFGEFDIKNFETRNKTKMSLKQKYYDFWYKVLNKYIRYKAKYAKRDMKKEDYEWLRDKMQKKLNKNGLYYYIPTMKPFYKSKTKNIIFYGSFEVYEIMKKYKKNIKKMYVGKNEFDIKDQEMLNKIKKDNSICVTIRRGDFLRKEFINNHYICTPEYFEKAIDIIKEKVGNPLFVVFSDDVDWCKKNMKFPDGTVYESGKNTISEKIELMSSCKNFIISNSTFSWWVQFLSDNNNKVVVAPKKWNNFEYKDEIYEPDWILI